MDGRSEGIASMDVNIVLAIIDVRVDAAGSGLGWRPLGEVA